MTDRQVLPGDEIAVEEEYVSSDGTASAEDDGCVPQLLYPLVPEEDAGPRVESVAHPISPFRLESAIERSSSGSTWFM